MSQIGSRPPMVPSKLPANNNAGKRRLVSDGGDGDDGQQQQQQQQNDGEYGQQDYNDDLVPMDQPMQRSNNNNGGGRPPMQRNGGGGGGGGNRRGPAASGYGGGGNGGGAYRRGGQQQQQQMNDGGDDDGGMAPAPIVLSDDPQEAKRQMDQIESKRKTDLLRKKCQPAAPSVVNVSQRHAPAAIKLAQLNPDLCDLDEKATKSKTPGQAMYFVSHLYNKVVGPTIQVEGRLTATPSVSATYDTTNFTIELHDPIEQRNWSALSRMCKRNFMRLAVEKKWPVAGTSINKMVYRDPYLRGKIINEKFREKYADPDLLPLDMIDPETKEVIECYPPRIKAQLVMSKKDRNTLETDVMDENDVQMNPYDFKRGNWVRMAIALRYVYYKAQTTSVMPNEYGLPCKLAMVKRMDQKEEIEGGPLKRTKWAEDAATATPNPTATDAPTAPAPATTISAPIASAPAAIPAASTAAAAATNAAVVQGEVKAVDALAQAAGSEASAAALRATIQQQVQATIPPKPAASAAGISAAGMAGADKKDKAQVSSPAPTTAPTTALAAEVKKDAKPADKPKA